MPDRNDFSWNMVVMGFAKSGELRVARRLFDDMPRKSGVAWNSMIHGYARNGLPIEAIRLFKLFSLNCVEPLRVDAFVLSTVIGACTNLAALDCGKQIHARILVGKVEFDSVLGSSLVNLYGKCGDLDSATSALNMMREPDDISRSALISGYASCGRMSDARRIFNSSISPCVILWTSMISGYVANGEPKEALLLFNEMRKSGIREDSSTVTSVLNSCCILGILKNGTQVHNHSLKLGVIHDIIIASALIDVYHKCGRPIDACELFGELDIYDTILLNTMITVYSHCGRVQDAKWVFDMMQSKSLISWNSMIVGFSQNGCPVEALDLFCNMNKLGLRIDKFNLASVISACGSIYSLKLGEQVFARAIVAGLDSDHIIATSLVDFYCKCGFVENGQRLFDAMMKSDKASWNSMLMGCATNGQGIEALKLFNDMMLAGVRPNYITFMGVLSACDHCGLVEEGQKWFVAMKQEYYINPGIEHYSCMIDLYSRTGYLEDVMRLIEQMPFEVDAIMWLSVLRGCVAHGYVALGKKVAARILELDPENSGAYVQLSSLCATSGEWEELAQVRKEMRNKQLTKDPGSSWTYG